MERISADEEMFRMAVVASLRSTCSRLQVGAVLAHGDVFISKGRNGAAQGEPHCRCSAESPCTASVHAEENAVAFAARERGGVAGATLYATHAPCYRCAGLLINSGIVRVVYGEDYRLTNGLTRLKLSGVVVEKWGSSSCSASRGLETTSPW